MCIWVRACACACVCVHVGEGVCMRMRMRMCVCVCVCVCVCARACVRAGGHGYAQQQHIIVFPACKILHCTYACAFFLTQRMYAHICKLRVCMRTFLNCTYVCAHLYKLHICMHTFFNCNLMLSLTSAHANRPPPLITPTAPRLSPLIATAFTWLTGTVPARAPGGCTHLADRYSVSTCPRWLHSPG